MPGATRATVAAEVARRPEGATTPEIAEHFGCQSSRASALLYGLWKLGRVRRIPNARQGLNVYIRPGSRLDGQPEPESSTRARTVDAEALAARIVEVVASRPDGITTAEVAVAMGIKANRAGLILGKLRDRGRLSSEPEPGKRAGVRWYAEADEDLALEVPTVDAEAMWAKAAAAGLRLHV